MKGILSSVIIMASLVMQDATLASEVMVYSAPDYATASDPNKTYLVAVNPPYESKRSIRATDFILDLRTKLAAEAYSDGKMSDKNLVIALQHYFQQRYNDYTKENNPLRKRKIFRDELVPAARAKVDEASSITLSKAYFLLDWGNSANSASVQVDPIRLQFDSQHCLPDKYEQWDQVSSSDESYFTFSLPPSHACELSVVIDDEDAAINMVDDIMDSALVRRTVLEVDPDLATFDERYLLNMNAKMMGMGLFKSEEGKPYSTH